MNKEAAEKRKAWVVRHSELTVVPSMKRRKEGHDYYDRCTYMVTMCVVGRKPILGTLRGSDTNHPHAWVEPSKMGLVVIEQWCNISIENPEIKTLGFQLMPDHIHGIIFVTKRLNRHFGHVISRFKAKSTALYRDMSVYSETESRTIQLWEMGYNDRILKGKGQLKNWINYIKDNPRRSLVKRNHSELFTIRQDIIVGTTKVAIMGNRSLLDYPYKIVVQCSRSLTMKEIEEACSHFLSMAKDGAVLVSPCISLGEKTIMRKAFEAGYPEIILLDNGFSPLQKPSGRQFDACAESRLLLVAPREHHNTRSRITRNQCLALNRLAEDIALCETLSRSTLT